MKTFGLQPPDGTVLCVEMPKHKHYNASTKAKGQRESGTNNL